MSPAADLMGGGYSWLLRRIRQSLEDDLVVLRSVK